MNEFIRQEARNAKKGLPARIIVKCNSLIDKETIDNLYDASCAGVEIDLIIRGICGLVPGLKGISENIRVRSILGRYLEHSRIFYFQNAGKDRPLIYAGSADWMARNFYRRIEVVFPVEQEELRNHIMNDILDACLRDTTTATRLRPNGSYRRVMPAKNEAPFCVQQHFIQQAKHMTKAAEVASEQPEELD
jgi:polyphosphate kinase